MKWKLTGYAQLGTSPIWCEVKLLRKTEPGYLLVETEEGTIFTVKMSEYKSKARLILQGCWI